MKVRMNAFGKHVWGIELRYVWISFLGVGTKIMYIFLIQSVPSKSPQEIIRVVKSITVKRVFAEHPEGKKKLWGGEFWSDGYFVTSVGRIQTKQ